MILDKAFVVEERSVSSIDTLQARIEQDSNRSFDLVNTGPLRVVFYQLEQADDTPLYYILINTHHVASDGWSTPIFHRDLIAYYQHYAQGTAMTLPEMQIQYKDFAVWQRQYLQGDRLETQLSFWKEQLADYEPLNLPLDKTRPAMTDYTGAHVHSQLNLELSMGIREIAKAQGCSVYTVMLSAFYIMLSKWSGQEDITIGGITANRHYPGVQDLIGFLRKQGLKITILGFFIFLHKTKLGVWMRAVRFNPEIATAMGIPTKKIYLFTFAIGFALAAQGGVVAAPITTVDFQSGVDILPFCFMAVIIGGLGNLEGTVAAAIILSVFEGIVTNFTDPTLATVSYTHLTLPTKA